MWFLSVPAKAFGRLLLSDGALGMVLKYGHGDMYSQALSRLGSRWRWDTGTLGLWDSGMGCLNDTIDI